MSFTGTPIVTRVSNNLFRITGLEIDASKAGTIKFADALVPGGVSLVAPNWKDYTLDDGAVVHLQDVVKVSVTAAQSDPAAAALPFSIVKTGTTHADFAITITNDSTDVVGTQPQSYDCYWDAVGNQTGDQRGIQLSTQWNAFLASLLITYPSGPPTPTPPGIKSNMSSLVINHQTIEGNTFNQIIALLNCTCDPTHTVCSDAPNNAAITALNTDLLLWAKDLQGHCLFQQFGEVADPAVQTQAGVLYNDWAVYIAGGDPGGVNVPNAIIHATATVAFCAMIQTRLNNGEWLGWLLPDVIDHMLREAQYFLAALNGTTWTPQQIRQIWFEFQADHAGFVAHFIDPTEPASIAQATAFQKAFSSYQVMPAPSGPLEIYVEWGGH